MIYNMKIGSKEGMGMRKGVLAVVKSVLSLAGKASLSDPSLNSTRAPKDDGQYIVKNFSFSNSNPFWFSL